MFSSIKMSEITKNKRLFPAPANAAEGRTKGRIRDLVLLEHLPPRGTRRSAVREIRSAVAHDPPPAAPLHGTLPRRAARVAPVCLGPARRRLPTHTPPRRHRPRGGYPRPRRPHRPRAVRSKGTPPPLRSWAGTGSARIPIPSSNAVPARPLTTAAVTLCPGGGPRIHQTPPAPRPRAPGPHLTHSRWPPGVVCGGGCGPGGPASWRPPCAAGRAGRTC